MSDHNTPRLFQHRVPEADIWWLLCAGSAESSGERRALATRGRLFCFGKREGKALGVPIQSKKRRRQPPHAATRHKKRHPCTARRRRMVCARNCAPAPIGQGERQECQRVSPKTPHLQEREARERVRPSIFPLIQPCSRSATEGPRLEARFALADRAGAQRAEQKNRRLLKAPNPPQCCWLAPTQDPLLPSVNRADNRNEPEACEPQSAFWRGHFPFGSNPRLRCFGSS